jgi:hypothetical protein
LLKIAPDNFLFAATHGAHPLGQCFALLKIAPGNFFFVRGKISRYCPVSYHNSIMRSLIVIQQSVLFYQKLVTQLQLLDFIPLLLPLG